MPRFSVWQWHGRSAETTPRLTDNIINVQWKDHPLFMAWIQVLVLFGVDAPSDKLLEGLVVERLQDDTDVHKYSVESEGCLKQYRFKLDTKLQWKRCVVDTAGTGTGHLEQPFKFSLHIDTKIWADCDKVTWDGRR